MNDLKALRLSLALGLTFVVAAGTKVHAQGTPPAPPPAATPVDEPTNLEEAEAQSEAPVDEPAEGPVDTPAEGVVQPVIEAPIDEAPEEGEADEVSPFVALRVHVITSANVYDDLEFDVFRVSDRQVVGRGAGANEAIGEPAASFTLEPGLYKIVKAGESFDSRVDFATVTVDEDTDYLIVVDADTGAFRGAGVVTEELPKGYDIAGVRLALNVGGTLSLNQKRAVVGGTNGVSSLMGIFGNFGMVFDRGVHFLTVDAKLQLNLQDAPTSGVYATTDYLEAAALYSYKINNPYVGPYARAGFKTRVFPGYLYLASEAGATGEVVINRSNGSTETYTFGGEANPDDLRIKVATPFAPFILQEEVGGNLKALDLDLKLLKASVATRLGFGFRQGITNGLYVVKGDERGSPVILDEVADYQTLGPLAGATASVTFARWLFGQAEASALLPLQDRDRAGSNVRRQILVDMSGTAGLKFPALTSLLHASFDYSFRLQRDGYLTGKTMFDQIVMARVSLQLF